MKIHFWKNNFLFKHIVFLTLLLTMASYPKSSLACPKGCNVNQSDRTGPIDRVFHIIDRIFDLAEKIVERFPLLGVRSGSNAPLGGQQSGSGGVSQINVLLTMDNSIGNDIGFVEQNIQDLSANLESLLPSENRVNISALDPTNASAQKLQNSISGLLKKLNEIPNDNAEVVIAKQNVLNELSISVVRLEQTNDLIKAINQAVAQSE